MDVQEAVALLRRFNAWRCGAAHVPDDAADEAPDPRKITKAIDTVCAALAKREAVTATDLLGYPIESPSKADLARPTPHRKPAVPAGYAANPGTGPTRETCLSCKYLSRESCARTYLKCWLMRKQWTGGPRTDILARSPACKLWEARDAAPR